MIPVTITVNKGGGDLVFTPHALESLSYVQSLSFDGDTVQADEITAVVRDNADNAADFLALWYGVNRRSAVWLEYSIPGGRAEKYYFKALRRVGKDLYQIDAQSPLARLTADFPGDIYDAVPLPDVIAAVIGNAVPYTCNPLLAAVRVYGWTPYQSRRETLHALAFAYGFLIRRNASHNLYFTVPDTTAYNIPGNNIFTGGSVDYSMGETYRNALITARDYRQNPDAAAQTLFDNSGSAPVERLIVKFDKPMFHLSADGLEIEESGVNYAVVSGAGTLTGKPYSEFVSVVSVDGDPFADPEHILTVTDAPLITSVNADSVGERLLSYHNAPATVNADIVRTSQKTGDCVSFTDPFGDAQEGFITSLSGSVTSFDRANAAIVCGYVPTWGAAYDAVEVLTGSGTWTAPGYLNGKPVRVVLIGGGQGGASGQHGADANGMGCGRGLPGDGGKILDVKITVTAGQKYSYVTGTGGAGGLPSYETTDERPDTMTVYVTRTGDRWHLNSHCNGGTYTPTTLQKAVARHLTPCENCVRDGSPYYVSNPGEPGTASTFGDYSSDDGQTADAGFYDVIDRVLYAAPGPDNGVDGGQPTAGTENGDRENPAYTDIQRFDVSPTWDAAQSWTSGNPGDGWHESIIQPGTPSHEWAYGGLGGGAAVGSDGNPGGNGRFTAYVRGGDGGDGADASAIFPPDTRAFGVGGSGGHGGGEGGKGGSAASEVGTQTEPGADGDGGDGSDGQAGQNGCILLYYKKSDDMQYSFAIPDKNLILTYYTAETPPYSIQNGHLIYEYPDGQTPPALEIIDKHLYLTE